MPDLDAGWFREIEFAVNTHEKIVVCGKDNDSLVLLRKMPGLQNRIRVVELESGDMADFLRFYKMYEFSDRICVLEETKQYGSLLNYLKTGLLSQEEYSEALLH